MWSIGCIFAEIVGLRPLFKGADAEEQLRAIFKVRGSPETVDWDVSNFRLFGQMRWEQNQPINLANLLGFYDPQGGDLLEKLLQMDPRKRISAGEALKHPFFDEIRKVMNQMYGEDFFDDI